MPSDCYLTALRILNYRFNSAAELRRKLQSKRFEKDVIEATIERLQKEHWLDDDRFAAAYVRTRLLKKIGPLRIRRELIAAGVDGDATEKALAENLDAAAQEDDLKAVCDKRARLLIRRHGAAFLDTPEGRNKLSGYLLKQGYDAALIRGVIRSIVKEIKVAHD